MKIKRNKKSYKWFLCGLILVVVLTITLIKGSRAGYKSTATIELTSGIVKYSSYDFNLISIYIDGVEQDKDTIIPDASLYEIDEDASYCCKTTSCNIENKDSNVILKTISGSHTFNGISRGSRCNLAFKKIKDRTMSELLDSYYIYKLERTAKNKDFNVPFGNDTKQTVYIAPDDDNLSYYFAGNPQDNWVEFGSYYWRIIRINGDGSIRMIYQGRTKDDRGNKLEPQATGEETQIGITHFNSNGNNEAVGYFYSIGLLRGLTYPSNIYTALNNWFNNSNLKQEQYFNKIDPNAGFCGDRQPSSSMTEINGSGGIGTTTTYYGAYIRLIPGGSNPTASSTTIAPTFNCADNDDLYTYSGAKEGNKKLENPVGMITADEVSYAGMIFNSAFPSDCYLSSGVAYRTISPSVYNHTSGGAVNFLVYPTGFLSHNSVDHQYGIRPVINIRSDVTFTGNGTQSNPYKVVV